MSDLGTAQDQEDRRRAEEEAHEQWERQEFWRKVRVFGGFATMIAFAIWYGITHP